MAQAARLDGFFYISVAEQPALTVESVAVAVGSVLVMGLGLVLLRIVPPLWWLIGSIGGATALLAFGTWFIVAVGGRLGGRARYDQMLRALGYAMAPLALGFLPWADFLIGFLGGGVWATACAVVAVRDVHGVPTGTAFALVVAPVLMVVGVLPLVVLTITQSG